MNGEQTQRAAFEKWAHDKWRHLDEFDLRKREDGSYKDASIQSRWEGWQAALASQSPSIAAINAAAASSAPVLHVETQASGDAAAAPSIASVEPELPPLPAAEYLLATTGRPYEPERITSMDGYSDDDMRAYATAAIEAWNRREAAVAHVRIDSATETPGDST